MFVNRTHGVVATTLGVLALGACASPEQNTDLRPEGPPETLAVLVMTDAASQLSEHATFCKPNDPKRPSLVGLPDASTFQICPDDGSDAEEVTDAYPDGWYVRIMFDELLDPSVEELVDIDDETQAGTIANTHPVELQCESVTGSGLVDVPYDGYYSPAGNNVTWPLGPSLVIKPNDPTTVATGTKCQVTINDSVTDKDGNPVPQELRGPFKFQIAHIQAIAIDPADDPDGESPIDAAQIMIDNAYLQFNTYVDFDSLCPDADGDGLCDSESVFSFKDVAHPTEGPGYCDNGTDTCGTKADCPTGATLCGRGVCSDGATLCNADADCATGDTCNQGQALPLAIFGLTDAEFALAPLFPLETEHTYTFSLTAGAKLKDRCGAETTVTSDAKDNTLATFKTNPFRFNKASIASGETSSAMKKLTLSYSNILSEATSPGDPLPASALNPADWDITPLPFDADGTTPLTKAEIQTIDPGGTGQAFFGGFFKTNTEYTFTLKAGAKVTDFYGKQTTNESEMKITWKTASAITATFSPAAGSTVTKASPASVVSITMTFNAPMDPTTFTATDFTLVDANGAAVPGLTLATGVFPNSCDFYSTGCQLRVRKSLAPGKYTFTLKAGAEISDVFGAKYTQAADKVITFEVKEAAATPAVQCL